MIPMKPRILSALLCLLLLCAFGCGKTEQAAEQAKKIEIGPDDVVLTVGDEPVYAVVYRYHLNERLQTIRDRKLYDYETYLSYVANPNISYVYAYYDTRTEEGMDKLCEDVLNELALQAAAIDTANKAGYELTAEDRNYILQAKIAAQDMLNEQLSENGGAYETIDAFCAAAGISEDRFIEMYADSMEAGLQFDRILEAYKTEHVMTDEELESGYERIVKETFLDRYTDGAYSQYLGLYIGGYRTFPSLYIPDDAIFVRLFVHTAPTEEQKAAYTEQAQTDFNTLYMSSENEFVSQGSAGDLAIAENDELIGGLFAAAKDVPVGSVGTLEKEADGKQMFYLFLRVDGETGTVPIDRYPGVRERIVSQLLGTGCMNTLREKLKDPSYAVRNEDVFNAIRPEN